MYQAEETGSKYMQEYVSFSINGNHINNVENGRKANGYRNKEFNQGSIHQQYIVDRKGQRSTMCDCKKCGE